MLLLRLYKNELYRSLQLWWSYRLDAIGDIGLWLIAFPLIMVMFDSIADGYGPAQQVESLIGFLVWDLCMSVLTTTAGNITNEANEGTLESVFISPLEPVMVFVLRLAAFFTRQLIFTAILGLGIMLILQLPLNLNLTGFVIIVLTVFAVGGVGLALGGLAIVFKNIASTVGVVTLLALFFTGAIIPLNELGWIFTWLKYLIPTTWGIDALRQSLLYDQGWLVLWQDGTLLGLSLQAVILVLFGMICFKWGVRRAQIQGRLGSY